MNKAAKENKAAIIANLELWAKKEKKRRDIEAQLAIDCATANAAHEKETRKFVEAASLALSSLVPELATLELQIKTDILAGCDAGTGVVRLPQVSTTLGKLSATAQVASKPVPRVINVGKFFRLCLSAENGLSIFFGCVTIGVTKAVECFGEHTVDTISTKTTKHSVELKLTA